MSTHALYVFKDKHDTLKVYGHCDGYPTGATEQILKSFEKSWELGRYEASDFAAAFVAANKTYGGGVYIVNKTKMGVDYRYVIEPPSFDSNLQPIVTAYSYLGERYNGRPKKIWKGNLDKMTEWAKSRNS